MSRSNPNEHTSANPAVRWFEWNGEHGLVRYYDKEQKKNVEVGHDFTFLLLDQVGSVRGWHDASDSGIYSNEVKDTRQERMIVKSFKGGIIAEGIYQDIKHKVNSAGGQFVANCYIAFKHDGQMAIGSLRFKGATLGAWMEFTRDNRDDLYSSAIRINGFTEGKKGRIVFRVPVFELKSTSDPTNAAAMDLDKQLQTFFADYFKKPKREQVEEAEDSTPDYDEDQDTGVTNELTDDDIPF